MEISVIIPAFNCSRTLEQTLRSLETQTRRDLVGEVIVVDSSNDGKSVELRKRAEEKGVRWIQAGRPTIPAIARNIGAHLSKGDLLVFIDSDVCLSEDWIEKIHACYQSGQKLGGGGVALPDFQKNKSIAWAQYFLQFNEYMASGSMRTKEFLPSCNMFCDRQIFLDSGGFPEIRASEDVLFFKEASRRAPVWFVPQARAYHIFRENLSDFLRNQKLLGRYIIVYRRRAMPNAFYYKKFWPIFFLPGFAFIKFWKISMRVYRSGPDLFWNYAKASPMFALGFFYWMIGFFQGASDEIAWA